MKQFEEIDTALQREVGEEAGISIEVIKILRSFHIFCGKKTAENQLIGIVFWCRTQEAEIKISREHTAYQWCTRDEARDLVTHPGIREDIELFYRERYK